MTRLSLGDFDAGWKAYEWRWTHGCVCPAAPAASCAAMARRAPVTGKTILLHAEQGIGDTIQFIRYAPLLAEHGRQGGLRGSAGIAAVIVASSTDIDHHGSGASRCPRSTCIVPCSVFPWPSATRPETIPAAVPYLAAPAERLAHWRDRLPKGSARAPGLSGPARRRTTMTPTGRSRSHGLPRLFEDPPVQLFQPSERTARRGWRSLARPAEPGPSRRRVSRFRRYCGRHFVARCRHFGRYGRRASGGRAGQAGRDPCFPMRPIFAG